MLLPKKSAADQCQLSSDSVFDVRQNLRYDLRLRLRPLRAAVVEADAHRARRRCMAPKVSWPKADGQTFQPAYGL